jgi:hypothetical protein
MNACVLVVRTAAWCAWAMCPPSGLDGCSVRTQLVDAPWTFGGHVCRHVQLTRFGSTDNSALGGGHMMTVDHPVACARSEGGVWGVMSCQAW